jgi:hypothetical protein
MWKISLRSSSPKHDILHSGAIRSPNRVVGREVNFLLVADMWIDSLQAAGISGKPGLSATVAVLSP